MKKNAFTLVELLSTVVILGIIMGIAAISYSNYIASSKQKSYEDGEKTLRASAESFLTYCSTSPFANSSCQTMPETGHTVTIDLETLTDNGFMDPVADQSISGFCSGNVKVTNKGGTDNFDLEYKVCLTCSDYKSKDCE